MLKNENDLAVSIYYVDGDDEVDQHYSAEWLWGERKKKWRGGEPEYKEVGALPRSWRAEPDPEGAA